MDRNWILYGIIALFVILLIIYVIRKNLKDKRETEKFFNKQFRQKKDKKLEEDDEY